ncbi:DUF2147 domain-containing protein [Roseovarius salis]|uniref:DUF2147 domain-containing protein n=1 Tax=Roseovarius salis TaxID=3376063 RepID=UPI0037C8F0DD
MTRTFMAALAIMAATAANSEIANDPVLGVWQTPPDRKDLVSHIRISPCGDAELCGQVLRSYAPSGEQVETPNVGKRIFWGVEPLGGGKYGNGTAWVPLLDVTARASMTLEGDTLRVRGCKAVLCDGQTWKRLR